MNHIFRVVFNHVCQTYQAVAEIAKGQSKSETAKPASLTHKKSRTTLKTALRPLSALIAMTPLAIHAAPTGGHISAGDASISQHGKITNIQQNSQKAAINWQTFGIKADETVNFKQPNAQAVILNRVIGNEKSVIDGAMNANGKVFISNPNGMIIGKNAQINVGALLATTAKIKDQDFMNGFFKFDEATGDITHLGDIKVPTGGVVALIAPIVENKGKITAPQGKVLLASAEQFSITLPDNGQFAYTLDRGTLQGLVDNGGAILADGGHVILTAKGTDTVKKSLIKHTGKIEANTVQNKNGVIELLGDLDNSHLEVSGSLKAEAKENGDGGFIETSAANVKIQETAQISTNAENGKSGKWLLDPNDLIVEAGGTMTGGQVETALQHNGDFELKSTNGKADGKGDVIINDEINWNQGKLTLNAQNDIHINKTLNGTGTAKLALEYGQGTADGGESDYYIEKNTPLKDRTVKVNLPEGKNFSIKKGKDGRQNEFEVLHKMPELQDNGYSSFSDLRKGTRFAVGADMHLPTMINKRNFKGWNVGVTDFEFHGLGHNLDKFIVDYEYDNVGFFLTGSAQANARDFSMTNVDVKGQDNVGAFSNWGGGNAEVKNIYISGKVVGRDDVGGFTANDLSAENILFEGKVFGRNRVGGLTGRSHSLSGTIKNVSANADVQGKENVGGLFGVYSFGKKHIENAEMQGSVHGEKHVGGLVGYLEEKGMKNSHSSAKVTGREYVGGLVGKQVQNGSYHFDVGVLDSYATGQVKGNAYVGGLIGELNYSTNRSPMHDKDMGSLVKNTYATGEVIGDSDIGGLVGKVTKTDNTSPDTSPIIVNSFFDSETTKQSDSGKGTAKNTTEMKQQSTFTDWDFNHVWRIQEGVDYPRLRPLTKADVVVGGISTQPGHVLNMDIQAHHLNKTYDGQAVTSEDDLLAIAKQNGHDDIITVKGLVGGDQLSDLEGKLVYGGTWQNAKNAGSYTIEPSGLSGGQKYAVTYKNGSLTIDPKTIAIFGQKYYDGSTKVDGKNNTKLNFVGRVNNDPIELLGEGVLTDKNASASDSDLDLKHLRSHNFSLSNPNYVLDSNQDKHRWSISKKPINLIVNGEKVHDGNRIAVLNQDTQKVTNDILASDTSHVDFTGEVTLSGSESGTHTIESHNVVLTGEEAKNYTIEKVEGSWKIKDVPVTTTPTTTPPVTTPTTTTPPVTTPTTTTPPVTTPTTTTPPVTTPTTTTPPVTTPTTTTPPVTTPTTTTPPVTTPTTTTPPVTTPTTTTPPVTTPTTTTPPVTTPTTTTPPVTTPTTTTPPVTTPTTTTPPVTTPTTTTPPVTTPTTTTPPVTTPTTTTPPVTTPTTTTPPVTTPTTTMPNTQQQDNTSTKPLPEYHPDLQNEIGNAHQTDSILNNEMVLTGVEKVILPTLESAVDEVVMNELISSFGFFISTIKDHQQLVNLFDKDLINAYGSADFKVKFMNKYGKRLIQNSKPDLGWKFAKNTAISILADFIVADLKGHITTSDPFLAGVSGGILDVAKILIVECLSVKPEEFTTGKAMELKIKLLAQLSMYTAKQSIKLGIEASNFDAQVQSLLANSFGNIIDMTSHLTKLEAAKLSNDSSMQLKAQQDYDNFVKYSMSENVFMVRNLGFNQEKMKEIDMELANIIYLFENGKENDAYDRFATLKNKYHSTNRQAIFGLDTLNDISTTIVAGGISTLLGIFTDKYQDTAAHVSFREHANIFSYGDYIDLALAFYLNKNKQ